MGDFYVDTDDAAGTDSGANWANACTSLDQCLTLGSPPAAGDTIWIQGAANDLKGSALTLLGGTQAAPIRYIGVANGTTAEPPASADITTASTGTKIGTSVGQLITGNGTEKLVYMQGLDIESAGDLRLDDYTLWHTVDCTITVTGATNSINPVGNSHWYSFDCIITCYFISLNGANTNVEIMGGSITTTHATVNIYDFSQAQRAKFIGVDFSGITCTNITNGGGRSEITFSNCRFPSSWTFAATRSTRIRQRNQAIGCNATGTLAAGSSYQDYEAFSYWGDVDNSTEFRTGGATDGATGTFSYAITPTANVMEGSHAYVESPWMRVWVEGGTRTFTVYITNGTGDLNRDEIWCEFLYANSADTTDHTMVFDPSVADRAETSTTIVTDDTGSTWDTNNTHKQKFTTGSVTVGYASWAYARVYYAKPSGAAVYVDPKIEVT